MCNICEGLLLFGLANSNKASHIVRMYKASHIVRMYKASHIVCMYKASHIVRMLYTQTDVNTLSQLIRTNYMNIFLPSCKYV